MPESQTQTYLSNFQKSNVTHAATFPCTYLYNHIMDQTSEVAKGYYQSRDFSFSEAYDNEAVSSPSSKFRYGTYFTPLLLERKNGTDTLVVHFQIWY